MLAVRTSALLFVALVAGAASGCNYQYPQPHARSDASVDGPDAAPLCGNSQIDQGEDCDGTLLGGATCASQGRTSGVLACEDCHFDISGCYACGNNSIEGPEACDGANLDMETCVTRGFHGGTLGCKSDCLAFDISGCGVCGDGIREAEEPCDGGDFGDATCMSLGFGGGFLSCANCVILTSDCTP